MSHKTNLISTIPGQSQIQYWLLAARPKTLPAAAAPVIVGSSVAFYTGFFRMDIAVVTLVAALLLQIGANLANDYYDYHKGADTTGRLGPVRVTQAGLLKPRQVILGMWFIFFLAALCGLFLYTTSGWAIIIIGSLSILAAIGYTGGPLPYGYRGLGDIFVFIFFGLVAVSGTFFLQAGYLSKLAFLSSIPIGCLATAILVVNNIRDISNDRKAGKITLAVHFGRRVAIGEYILLLAIAYLAPLWMILSGTGPGWLLLTWLTLPLLPGLIHSLAHQHGRSLNLILAATGKLELSYAIVYAIGLVIARVLL
jgi:1,4-dihydroxy-2-naphthoate polyprenyltransferase